MLIWGWEEKEKGALASFFFSVYSTAIAPKRPLAKHRSSSDISFMPAISITSWNKWPWEMSVYTF